MDRGAWWAAVYGVAQSQTWLSDFTFTFHFHALEKEMATHSSVLAWRISRTGEPGGLPSMGSHRVRHDWSDLAAAARTKQAIFGIVGKYHLHVLWSDVDLGTNFSPATMGPQLLSHSVPICWMTWQYHKSHLPGQWWGRTEFNSWPRVRFSLWELTWLFLLR